MDCDTCAVQNTDGYTRFDQYTCPGRYPHPDLHGRADSHRYAAAEPDPPPDGNPLAHLDTYPDADQHNTPDSHPGPSGDIHVSPDLDTPADGYTLAGPYAHSHPIRKCVKPFMAVILSMKPCVPGGGTVFACRLPKGYKTRAA